MGRCYPESEIGISSDLEGKKQNENFSYEGRCLATMVMMPLGTLAVHVAVPVFNS